jgi:hypothetical protein
MLYKLYNFRLSNALWNFYNNFTLRRGGRVGTPQIMEKKEVAINFVISRAELDAFDEWCFKERIRSRSEAIRLLMSDGITRPAPVRPRAKGRSGGSASQ